MTLRPIAGLVLAVMLAGCQSVDVKPAQPTLQIPAQWRADAVLPARRSSSGGAIFMTTTSTATWIGR